MRGHGWVRQPSAMANQIDMWSTPLCQRGTFLGFLGRPISNPPANPHDDQCDADTQLHSGCSE